MGAIPWVESCLGAIPLSGIPYGWNIVWVKFRGWNPVWVQFRLGAIPLGGVLLGAIPWVESRKGAILWSPVSGLSRHGVD